jgi:hypothetical protein
MRADCPHPLSALKQESATIADNGSITISFTGAIKHFRNGKTKGSSLVAALLIVLLTGCAR